MFSLFVCLSCGLMSASAPLQFVCLLSLWVGVGLLTEFFVCLLVLCAGNPKQLHTESIYFKSSTYGRIKKMENFRSGRAGAGVQESQTFFFHL